MLFNFYRNTLYTIKQWSEITAAIFNPYQHPVKIRIKVLDTNQQYEAQRKSYKSNHRY